MAESATKPDPAAEATASSEPRLAKDETEKLTTGLTEESKNDDSGSGSGNVGVGGVIGGAKAVTEKATSAVKDNVFAMFGGGTKKEAKDDRSGEGGKKEEDEEGADEPSGSAKAVREKEEKEKREKEEKGEKGEVCR